MRLDVRFNCSNQNIAVTFNGIQTVTLIPKEYEGNYEVIPKVTSQVLETKHKYMTDDLTINKIPYAVVTNNAGGLTATIGKEV